MCDFIEKFFESIQRLWILDITRTSKRIRYVGYAVSRIFEQSSVRNGMAEFVKRLFLLSGILSKIFPIMN